MQKARYAHAPGQVMERKLLHFKRTENSLQLGVQEAVPPQLPCLGIQPILFLRCFASSLTTPGAFFLPVLSHRDPGSSSRFPLTACFLIEILSLVSLASVLLLAHGLCTFQNLFHIFGIHCSIPWPGQFPELTHTGVLSGNHTYTHGHTHSPERKLAYM